MTQRLMIVGSVALIVTYCLLLREFGWGMPVRRLVWRLIIRICGHKFSTSNFDEAQLNLSRDVNALRHRLRDLRQHVSQTDNPELLESFETFAATFEEITTVARRVNK